MNTNNVDQEGVQTAIRHIISMVTNISLYGVQHPQIQYLCDKALSELNTLLAENRVLTLKLVDNRLVGNDIRQEQSLTSERFIALLTAKNIHYLELSSGLTGSELLSLAEQLNSQKTEPNRVQTPHIQTGRLTVKGNTPLSPETICDFSELTDKHCDKFIDTFTNAGKQQKISAAAISEMVDDFITAFSSHSQVMLALTPLRSMDEYLYVHSTNICLLNLAQAKLLGITGQPLKDIGIAAMLHDVGKMFIPSEILNKPGRPDEREWELLKQHPRLGAEYLINCPGIPFLAVTNAYEHHIGFDGTGYPHSRRSRNLSICSHMTTISDIYDALRTRRSYKDPMNFSRIKQIMEESIGKSLHPQLTRSFLNAMSKVDHEELPQGS